jgi:hypothetical protein
MTTWESRAKKMVHPIHRIPFIFPSMNDCGGVIDRE